MPVDSKTLLHGPCRRMNTRALIYDLRNGLAFLNRKELPKAVTGDWYPFGLDQDTIEDIPLDAISKTNASAVAGRPRYPLSGYQWLQRPTYDQSTGIARWSFVASTSTMQWGAFTWMLFDENGYTSVLLLSRPSDQFTTWRTLQERREPPFRIDNLVPRSVPALVIEGDSYGAGFLALLHHSDGVGCALGVEFGRGY